MEAVIYYLYNPAYMALNHPRLTAFVEMTFPK